jgi:methylornithine synthase
MYDGRTVYTDESKPGYPENRRPMNRLETILNGVMRHRTLPVEDILFILGLRQEEQLEILFRAARDVRRQHFGDTIFLYGFLYLSTHCRNDCIFCHYRTSNNNIRRYRKEEFEITAAAELLAKSGVHLIDLTVGEDPLYHNENGNTKNKTDNFSPLVRLVKEVKERSRLPVMISPGVVPVEVVGQLADAGADWLALYQETHNPELFSRLRPRQDYRARWEIKRLAGRQGLLIEEGILVGVGETDEDIVRSMAEIRRLEVQQVRAMNFVPQPGTPLYAAPAANPLRELKILALMRLLFPEKLIPATLDVEGLAGLRRRLDAGANVVTSIVPPRQGLAGVAQSSLDIDSARRTAESVRAELEACSLRTATTEEYCQWIKKAKKESDISGEK